MFFFEHPEDDVEPEAFARELVRMALEETPGGWFASKVKEAGGYVTDFRGGDRPMERNEFLAANDALHSRLHKLVAGALR